ncbi:hypothetical protein N9X63_00030 [Woeseiaceae bacterium]|jgi:predicted methyltransferase|nr:hypothetical protein [Woeseiaceae bacterium]
MMFRLILVVLGFLISTVTFAQNNNAIEDKVNAALSSEIRTTAEKARDRNRKPLETLNFFQLKDDMRVLELVPGGGWYTKLLAPVLKENGEYYVAVWADNLKKGLLSQKGFEHVKTVDGINPSRSGVGRLNTIEPFSLGLINLDLVVTFRNMHNFDVPGRNAINQATYDALKSGGLYGVIDHTRRHMQPMTNEVWRRADPMQITKELLDIGFELAAYSDLHYRPDDELRYEVGRKSVTGNTDRFTMLFRKP